MPYDLVMKIMCENLRKTKSSILDVENNEWKGLFLLNKRYTEEYLKINFMKMNYHTNMPFYVDPLFPYYSYITKLKINIETIADREKWANFLYCKLENCTSIYVRVTAEHTNLDMRMLQKIKFELPLLESLSTFDATTKSNSKAFELFHDSNLKKLHCNLVVLYSNNSSKLSHFSSHLGWIDLNIDFVFFNITSLEVSALDNQISPHTFLLFKSMSSMFPNLNHCRLDNIASIECFSFIPSVKTLELKFQGIDLSFDSCNAVHDTITFGFEEAGANTLKNSSSLDYLRRCSKQWILTIGQPNFLIITNIPSSINDLINKFDHSISIVEDLFGAMDYEDPEFKSRECNSIWIHSSFKSLPPYRMSDDLLDFGLELVDKITKGSNV